MWKLIPSVFAAFLCVGPAASSQVSGNDLYQACQADDATEIGFCVGYVVGVVEGMTWGSSIVGSQLEVFDTAEGANDFNGLMLGFCITQQISNDQVLNVVVNHLRDNPQNRHQAARGLVLVALREAFNCP